MHGLAQSLGQVKIHVLVLSNVPYKDGHQNGHPLSVRTRGHNNNLPCALLPLLSVGHYVGRTSESDCSSFVCFLVKFQST